jgi:hypothetical protein
VATMLQAVSLTACADEPPGAGQPAELPQRRRQQQASMSEF